MKKRINNYNELAECHNKLFTGFFEGRFIDGTVLSFKKEGVVKLLYNQQLHNGIEYTINVLNNWRNDNFNLTNVVVDFEEEKTEIDNLTITRENVLKLVKEKPESKEYLQTLFPEVFKKEDDSKYFNLSPLHTNDGYQYMFSNDKAIQCGFNGQRFMQVRVFAEYKNKAFYLSSSYNWELITDSTGALCLVPTKKQQSL